MRLTKILFSFFIIILFVSCGGGGGGGSSSGGGTDSTMNVAGTWRGTGNSPQTGSVPTTLILTQSGNSVSGTWDGYAVTGTVSGNQLALTLTPFTDSGVYFTGSGSATVTGNSMSGTTSMTGTSGGRSVTVDGTFTAARSDSKAGYITDHAPAGGFIRAVAGAIAH